MVKHTGEIWRGLDGYVARAAALGRIVMEQISLSLASSAASSSPVKTTTHPSSASSDKASHWLIVLASTPIVAASSANAIGGSEFAPSLSKSAGERFRVMYLGTSDMPHADSASRIRSLFLPHFLPGSRR